MRMVPASGWPLSQLRANLMIDRDKGSDLSIQLVTLIDVLDLMTRYIPYLELLFDDVLDINTQRIILSHYLEATQSAIQEMRSLIEEMRRRAN